MQYEPMTILTFAILAFYLINNTFTFRFQRTTLSISQVLFNEGNPRIQVLMSPIWLGILGWTNTGLTILLSVLMWISFGWIYTILFWAYALLGTAIVDSITPFPSYNFCFRIIKKSMKKDLSKTQSIEDKEILQEMLSKVENIESEYLKDPFKKIVAKALFFY